MRTEPTITIREANAGDGENLKRLAERDSASLSEGQYLLAESGGVALAAIESSTGLVIADPFEPTAHLIRLLEEADGSHRAAGRQLLRLRRLATGNA
jgi:hypothetical protein